jgi:hypothetical protein
MDSPFFDRVAVGDDRWSFGDFILIHVLWMSVV